MPQDKQALDRQAMFAWNLLTELRKELLESQKLRTQIIGLKVTFVSAGFAVIAANIDKVPNSLLTIPAFAAIFFDFLINSYSFSIKRIGWYCRNYLEPILKVGHDMPEEILLWEEFLAQPRTKQYLAMIGNLGITLLAFSAGVFALLTPFRRGLSTTLLLTLALLLFLDAWSFWFSKRRSFPAPAQAEEV